MKKKYKTFTGAQYSNSTSCFNSFLFHKKNSNTLQKWHFKSCIVDWLQASLNKTVPLNYIPISRTSSIQMILFYMRNSEFAHTVSLIPLNLSWCNCNNVCTFCQCMCKLQIKLNWKKKLHLKTLQKHFRFFYFKNILH